MEKRGITMGEFKTVVEDFKSDIKKVVEVVNYRFDQQDKRIDKLGNRMDVQEKRSLTMMEQIALSHEGQTGIKAELRTELKKQAN